MNAEQLEGKWEQIKGDVRKHFGKLTEDDVTEVRGRRQKLIGKIREAYGDAEEAATEKVDAFLDALQRKVS